MRRAAALALALAAIAAAPRHAAADLPTGRVSLVGGPKHGTGALAGTIAFGLGYGLEAGYAPMSPSQRLGWGASWSIVWSDYFSGSARVADSLKMVELDLGLRVRALLGAGRRQALFLGGGGAVIRTNEPLFVGGDRSHLGAMGQAGIELERYGFLFAATLRYAVLRDGQGTLGLQLSVGRGQ